jgi:hypothetical protein
MNNYHSHNFPIDTNIYSKTMSNKSEHKLKIDYYVKDLKLKQYQFGGHQPYYPDFDDNEKVYLKEILDNKESYDLNNLVGYKDAKHKNYNNVYWVEFKDDIRKPNTATKDKSCIFM